MDIITVGVQCQNIWRYFKNKLFAIILVKFYSDYVEIVFLVNTYNCSSSWK
ncbi:Uncharacterized protein TCM_006122 [Theobroma cacao]|uniref:Uncharacterized protein n=1 Tax=Theobroma cacao TaxID=3641 RepID=A0A061DX53_THECC|nr:Uncharacterized protein TCM_006122 [Theobroma cacao]